MGLNQIHGTRTHPALVQKGLKGGLVLLRAPYFVNSLKQDLTLTSALQKQNRA